MGACNFGIVIPVLELKLPYMVPRITTLYGKPFQATGGDMEVPFEGLDGDERRHRLSRI